MLRSSTYYESISNTLHAALKTRLADPNTPRTRTFVGLDGIEPSTSALSVPSPPLTDVSLICGDAVT